MGCLASKPDYITSSNGNERDYQERFLEGKTLGQGEFGIVKLVHDVKNKDLIGAKPLAVKFLRKGYQFKDNTIYTPIKKETLQGEVDILRRLNGECFNLQLIVVYESSSQIMMVTEYCEGGEMMPFVASAFDGSKASGGLRTEDVSRICYQLLSAVDHCARHRVIHRDIKPENVMFCTPQKDSELRLIDFGSGTLDNSEVNTESVEDEVDRHHTFAGSAFYISPEMFQHSYTSKTDVWSAGASLYVLVAGYPADKLQQTFNILQTASKPTDPQQPGGRLRKLPNLPDNLPDSFYTMLEGALKYGHKSRSSAGELIKGEFPQFHIQHADGTGTISIQDIAAEAARKGSDKVTEMSSQSLSRTSSVLLEGSVRRHTAYLGYQKFERSVTTLLATMLPKDALRNLVAILKERGSNANTNKVKIQGNKEKEESAVEVDVNGVVPVVNDNASKLQVVTMSALLNVLKEMDNQGTAEVINMIESLQNYKFYENFAYHVSLLRQFVSIHSRLQTGEGDHDEGDMDFSVRSATSFSGRASVRSSFRKPSGRASNNKDNMFASIKKLKAFETTLDLSNSDRDVSMKSTGGLGGMRRVNTATGALSGM